MKIKVIFNRCLIVVSFFLLSCTSGERENIFDIKFENYSFILKNNESGTFSDIPQINLKFTVKNMSNNINYFSTKENLSDKKNFSRFYLLDTLQGKIIPIYSSSRLIIEGIDEYDIFASINLKENKEYFSLSDDFFKKDNYNYDSDKLNDLFLKMINNSILIYKQDRKDLESFKFTNVNPNVISDHIFLAIRKPKNINKNYYGIKKKPLKIINL